jgi:hypothetical protein
VASPNGYITSETFNVTTRDWMRVTLSYDTSNPPWTGPGQLASSTFEIQLSSSSATGPWFPAPITTSLVTACSPIISNVFAPNGATDTVFAMGGPGQLTPGTNYWMRVILRDGVTVLEDYVVGPHATEAYPNPICLSPTNVTSVSADVHMVTGDGIFDIDPPCDQDTVVWEIGPTTTGPWTASAPEPLVDYTPDHSFAGLTPDTQYFYRARFRDGSGTQYALTDACQFRTLAVTVPPFNPQPCTTNGGGSNVDVENTVLCDLDAEGNLLGTALAVYEYDSTGNPVGAPTFVDPVTGLPYVPQGTLQVCPDSACLPPMQFCQTDTTTGPVEHPGRMYDITLPINPGFAVQSLQVDAVTNAANIVWDVADPDGELFRQDLTAFIEGRIPASATVTITNPNAGTPQVCGTALPMTVHIECLRLDQNPPNLIELVYNGGQDLIQNPAYNEFPALNPPVSQGNYGFHLLARQDDPGPFPGNPPSGRVLCTSVANRGWETNDSGRTFEIWGKDVADAQNTTPTPRGTPVQEITSDGPPPGGKSTIWQTFVAPSNGNFIIRLVHGARDNGEQHRITLDNGDTGDTQNGDLIDDNTTPPSVTSSGGPNPWTQFNQTIPLNGGSTYTLALSTTNPVGGARGGLFTDMRAYIDRPDQRATAVTNDDICIVTTQETSTTTLCSFWQPQCVGGTVAGWQKVDTGESLTNAEFWAQVPTPKCCTTEAPASTGGSSLSNMLTSDLACAVVGGIPQTVIRMVVTDPSGGTLQEQFLSQDGGPVTPDSWTPGACTTETFITEIEVCEVLPNPGGGVIVNPLREATSWAVDVNGNPRVVGVRYFQLGSTTTYNPSGSIQHCDLDKETLSLCDVQTDGTVISFQRTWVYNLAGVFLAAYDTTWNGVNYTPTGSVRDCAVSDGDNMMLGLCLSDGTPIGIITRRDPIGTVTEDGWINLLTGAFSAGVPPVGTVSCSSSQSIQTSGVFCDIDGSNNVQGIVVIEYHYAADGSIDSVRLVDAVTGATYTPVGTITVCPTGGEQSADRDLIVLCDDNGGVLTPFVRDFQRNNLGAIVGHTDYTLGNAPYTPTGTVGFCTPNTRDSETVELCDFNAGVPTPFLRTFVRDTNGVITVTLNQTLGGAPYTPTGTVAACEARDSESVILCDSAVTPIRFLRTYTYNATGAVSGFTDTTLAGAPFTPTGAVGVCATTVQSDTDFVEEILCDANGTAFIRLFRFNSATGALISTTNTTLAGAAFTPVGTVGLCSDCCPNVVADDLCTNTGSGHGTAIRATNGTVTLIDSVTGATITSGNIVPCPSDNTVVTLTSEARVVTNATPWTPGGDVTGTLTSVTATGISGLWDMVDASGTTLTGLPAGLTVTWNAEDDNILTGPQSITPQSGSTVVVNWTRK